jgi:hypothetical protein
VQHLEHRLIFAAIGAACLWYIHYANQTGAFPLNHRNRSDNPSYFYVTVTAAGLIGIFCIWAAVFGSINQ